MNFNEFHSHTSTIACSQFAARLCKVPEPPVRSRSVPASEQRKVKFARLLLTHYTALVRSRSCFRQRTDIHTLMRSCASMCREIYCRRFEYVFSRTKKLLFLFFPFRSLLIFYVCVCVLHVFLHVRNANMVFGYERLKPKTTEVLFYFDVFAEQNRKFDLPMSRNITYKSMQILWQLINFDFSSPRSRSHRTCRARAFVPSPPASSQSDGAVLTLIS